MKKEDEHTKKKKEEEFDKYFKKVADKLAVQLNNHYETKFVSKYGDILDLHTKH